MGIRTWINNEAFHSMKKMRNSMYQYLKNQIQIHHGMTQIKSICRHHSCCGIWNYHQYISSQCLFWILPPKFSIKCWIKISYSPSKHITVALTTVYNIAIVWVLQTCFLQQKLKINKNSQELVIKPHTESTLASAEVEPWRGCSSCTTLLWNLLTLWTCCCVQQKQSNMD